MQAGALTTDVARALGHASFQTTARHYADQSAVANAQLGRGADAHEAISDERPTKWSLRWPWLSCPPLCTRLAEERRQGRAQLMAELEALQGASISSSNAARPPFPAVPARRPALFPDGNLNGAVRD